MRHIARGLVLILLGVALTIGVSACDWGSSPDNKGQNSESDIQQNNYNRLAAKDPAHTMSVSPTRDTINFWIDTWGKDPDKLSYIYLSQPDGSYGYYIFKGLPVNYCVSLTPNYKFVNPKGDGSDTLYMVPAPSIDGVYYSGGGCQSYYGRDATTNAYMEYTAGVGQNVVLSDRPIPYQHVTPLGFTTIAEAAKAKGP